MLDWLSAMEPSSSTRQNQPTETGPSGPDVSAVAENQRLKAAVSQLSKLLEVSRLMFQERNLDRLLQSIAGHVSLVLDADRCAIFLVDEESNEIWSRVVLGQDKEIRFPMGAGIAGAAIASGQPQIIDDAYADKRFNRKIDDETGYRTRSILCLPLRNHEGKILGCFQVINKREGKFTRADLEFLEAFSAHAAVSIESAALNLQNEKYIRELTVAQDELGQKMRQLEIVYQLERTLNESSDFDQFMERVIHKAAEALDGTGGTILLLDEGSRRLLFSYRSGEGSDRLTKLYLEENEGIAGYVVNTGESVLGTDVESDPRHSKRVAELVGVTTGSILAVPLVMNIDGKSLTIGALEVVHPDAGVFSRDDLAVLQIISAQVTSAIMRKKLLDEEHRARRLATVGTLASTIIHDFKNPMSIIRGYAELLQLPQLPEEKRNRYCKVIVAEVDRCVTMTQELLYFARGEKNYNFISMPIGTFLEDISLVLEREFQDQEVAFEQVLDYRGPVRLDPDKMKRVIFNLSSNAIGVLEAGDRFTIRTSLDGEFLEIRVQDTGPGIPEAIRDRLFDAFVTHGKTDGTGLGLCIAKEIVEGHGGTIHLDTTVSSGACFVIRLPRPEAAT